MYVEGTRDSFYDKKEHAYIIFELRRCDNDTREEGDPVCATPEDTDEWLSTKYAFLRILNTKIDFSSFSKVATE